MAVKQRQERKQRNDWSEVLAMAYGIVESYDTPVTLRQLFYQLVAASSAQYPGGIQHAL